MAIETKELYLLKIDLDYIMDGKINFLIYRFNLLTGKAGTDHSWIITGSEETKENKESVY